jgi:HAD superfamily hydrolase (TIGR01662 family)
VAEPARLRRAVLLDRDGVINTEVNYLWRPEDFAFVPGTPQALAALQDAGWALVVVTNQSGIARGYYTEADYQRLTAHLRAELAHNYDAHGFIAITNRATPPPDGNKPDDNTLWQQAGPDWSSLAIQLGPEHSPTGANVTAALDPAMRQLENWRSRLRQLWNLAGLTSPTGAVESWLPGVQIDSKSARRSSSRPAA